MITNGKEPGPGIMPLVTKVFALGSVVSVTKARGIGVLSRAMLFRRTTRKL